MNKELVCLFPLVGSFLLVEGADKVKKENRPNVIVILADDLGFGDISAYGATEIKTPGIDRIAEEGIRFCNGYATSSTSTPSRFSMLTGRYPWRNGAYVLPGNAPLIIREDMPTLPQMFRQAGYTTGVIGKWHLGLGSGQVNWNDRIIPGAKEVGFDYSFITAATNDRVPTVFVENGRVANLDVNDPIEVSYQKNFPGEPTGKMNPELLKIYPSHGHDQSITNGISRIGYMRGGKSALWVDEDMADTFLNKAVTFVKEHREEPFFLYYALHEPHVPRVPNVRFAGKSVLGPRGDVILEADWCVGEFLKTLDELGLADNTVVIFTSDNGPVLDDGYKDDAIEKTGRHKPAGPLRGGKYSSYDGATHVPFLLRWPEKVKKGDSEALVCQIDFYASFAAMLGLENKTQDGQNILSALTGESRKGRESLLLEATGENVLLREGDWIYIPPMVHMGYNVPPTEPGRLKEPQLYHVKKDIGQKNNLAAKYPERVEKMGEKIRLIREK